MIILRNLVSDLTFESNIFLMIGGQWFTSATLSEEVRVAGVRIFPSAWRVCAPTMDKPLPPNWREQEVVEVLVAVGLKDRGRLCMGASPPQVTYSLSFSLLFSYFLTNFTLHKHRI